MIRTKYLNAKWLLRETERTERSHSLIYAFPINVDVIILRQLPWQSNRRYPNDDAWAKLPASAERASQPSGSPEELHDGVKPRRPDAGGSLSLIRNARWASAPKKSPELGAWPRSGRLWTLVRYGSRRIRRGEDTGGYSCTFSLPSLARAGNVRGWWMGQMRS